MDILKIIEKEIFIKYQITTIQKMNCAKLFNNFYR